MMRYLVLAVSILLGISAMGRNFPMLHYGVENGLPSNKIYSIYKDRTGFTWVSTDKGIARYNGAKFETFTTFNGLPDNEVFFFQEDLNGRLWLATYNGELCYYQNDTFHTAANTPFLYIAFRPKSYINTIFVEADSSITFRFNSEFNFINIKNNRCSVKYAEPEFTKRKIPWSIFSIRKINANEFDLFSENTIAKIDSNARLLSIDSSKQPFAAFLQNNNQFYFIKGSSFTATGHPGDTIHTLLNVPIKCIYFDGQDYFFLTHNAIYYHGDRQPILTGQMSAIGRDNKSDFWIGTLNKGIYVLKNNFIHTCFHNKAYHGTVRFSHCADSVVYFSTDSALYCLNNNEINKITSYAHHNNSNSSFMIDPNGDFYYFNGPAATTIRGLNPRAKNVVTTEIEDNSYKKLIWANNKLYAQGMTALLMVKDSSELSYRRKGISKVTNSLSRIYCVASDSSNRIWYTTKNNLYRIDKSNTITEMPLKSGFKNFDFVSNYLIGVLHNNTFLLCSDLDGRFLTDTVPVQNCIWENFYKLDKTHVLISTNNLYRLLTIYPGDKKCKYSIDIIEDPFVPLQPESFCCDKHNCYFFKDEAITIMPLGILFAKVPPPLLSYKFLNTGQAAYPITGAITIPFAEAKNITISFSALSFGGEHLEYQYSISKNKDEWLPCMGGNITAGNLGYGIYTIKVRAKTLSSAYSLPIIFTLIIAKPFWATWWFISLAVVLALCAAYIVIRQFILLAIRRKEVEHSRKLRYMRSEYKALNALMNPHFIFNTLNNLQSLFNGSDKRLANKYLRVFANLIRQNMHNISREEISLQQEMDLVANYLALEKMRFDDELEYNIHIQDNLDISDITIPPLLIQPLVENSIKHGILASETTNGFIQINIFEQDGNLLIEVKDNGPGIDSPAPSAHGMPDTRPEVHESYGLQNIKTRLAQLSAMENINISLTIRNIKDELTANHLWTVVTICMPLS